MSDMNVMSLTGRLTKDATFSTVGSSGKQLLSMSVAVNTGFGQSKKALFIKVNMWGERGEKIVQYLKRGTVVAVSGTLSLNEWTSADGTAMTDLVVTTFGVDFYTTSSRPSNDDNTYEQSAQDVEPVF